MDQTSLNTTDSLLGDSASNYLGYGSQRNSKVRQPSFFTFDPIPSTSGSQHFASSMSGSTDLLHLRMGPDLSIDPHYHPDFRRKSRLTGFGLEDAHSPFNDLSLYDDGLFSGESYRSSILNRPFFSSSFATSPSYSEPVGGCQDRDCIFHESSVPTTPTLLNLRPQRTSIPMGNVSLSSGPSQLSSSNTSFKSINPPLGSVNSQITSVNPPPASSNTSLSSSSTQLESANPPLQRSSNPLGSSPTPKHTSPSIQRTSPSIQRTSPQRSQRSQRHGTPRTSQSSPQRPNSRYTGNRSRTGSPGTIDVSNEVRLEDVESGKDRRTTLMIKNIPNA